MQEGGGGLDVSVRVADRPGRRVQGQARLRREPHRQRHRHDAGARPVSPMPTASCSPACSAASTCRARCRIKGVLVPDEAIGADQDRRIVFVVDADGTGVGQAGAHRPAHRRLPRHPRGPDRRRNHRRQRADAGAARRQGQGRDGDACRPRPKPPGCRNEVRAFLRRPPDLRVGPLDRPADRRLASPTRSCRSRNIRRSRRRPSSCAPHYPGADAETVAATVATPIEQEINGVEGMLYMSSYSSSDGAMSLTITFRLGTDLDQAQVLVQNRVSIAEPRLPEEVRRLGITTAKSSPDLMMVVHMLSPDDTYDQLYVSNYARSRVRDVLLQARRRRRPHHLRRARIFAAHLARSGEAVGLRHDRGRRRAVAARAERAGVGRLDRRAADRQRATPSSTRSPPRAASRTRATSAM